MPGKLVGGQQLNAFNSVDRALGFRIKGSQCFNFVIEQVDAVGTGGAHGEDVQDSPAHRVLAVFIDIIGVPVSGRFQLHAPVVDIQ